MAAKKTISDRSKKAEILEAYEELKEELKELKKAPKPETPSGEKQKPQQREEARAGRRPVVVPEYDAEVLTPEGLIQGISSLKVTIANALAELESRLVDESKKLQSIRKEIGEGKEMLQQIYDIELEAETLADLRNRQEEEKERFERGKLDTLEQWERDKKVREEQLKEEEEAIRRKREREKDEYEYQMKIRKQRDSYELETELEKKRTGFEESMKEREQAIREREAAVKMQEEELKQMRKDVEQFPKVLEGRVKEAEKEATKATEERFRMEKLSLEREMANLKEVNEITVRSLQERIQDQVARIKNLERDLKEAQAQTHTVATKAVEAVARIPYKPERVEKRDAED